MNSGSHDVIAPFEWKPRIPSAQLCWKTSTSRPYAAPTDSRLSSTAFIGITIDRNVTSSSRKQSASTNANTSGACAFICSLKSCVPAVSPVTAAFTPETVPSVDGITRSRSVSSALTDAPFEPFPCIAIETVSTVLSEFTSVEIGSNI